MNNKINDTNILNINNLYTGNLAMKIDGVKDKRFVEEIRIVSGRKIFIKNEEHSLSGFIDIETNQKYYPICTNKNKAYINDMKEFSEALSEKSKKIFENGITKEQLFIILDQLRQVEAQNEEKELEKTKQLQFYRR